MTLEERIKALMENTSLDEKETITTKNGTKIEDDESDNEKTDYSQDDGSKNDVSVDDEEDQDDDEDQDKQKQVKEDATNNMLTVGKSRKDGEGVSKLSAPPSGGDKKDDNGDNARLTVGKSRKDGEGVKGAKVSGQNDDNKKNNVDTQSLETKPSKITVGEHIEAMFSGQELSEEFVEKASTIFEAAVAQVVEQRLNEEIEALQEEFQTHLEEAVGSVQDELVESIDGFLNAVVEQWVEDNQIAVESGIKVEMVTNFIDGLKTLFKENYIEVPEEKLDVIEEQAAQIEELKSALITIDEAHDVAIAEVTALKRHAIIEGVANGLTVQQKEKFASLCEGLEFSDEDAFKKKVETVKESYFTNSPVKTTRIMESNAQTITESVDSGVNRYVEALRNPLKFSKPI